MGWYLALAFGLGVLWFWREGMKPAMNELQDQGAIARMLRYLLARGVYRADVPSVVGRAIICDRSERERCLVFTKYIRDGEAGVRVEFPLVAWSGAYYETFHAELQRRGVPHEEVILPTGRALAFDFGRDFGGAHVVAHVLFEDTLGLRISRDCVGYVRDCVDRNVPRWTGVDAPDVS